MTTFEPGHVFSNGGGGSTFDINGEKKTGIQFIISAYKADQASAGRNLALFLIGTPGHGLVTIINKSTIFNQTEKVFLMTYRKKTLTPAAVPSALSNTPSRNFSAQGGGTQSNSESCKVLSNNSCRTR